MTSNFRDFFDTLRAGAISRLLVLRFWDHSWMYCTATQPGPPWVMNAGLRG